MTRPLIQPGDCLLYSGHAIWSWIIKLKTWSDVSHVEVALNEHYTLTSREGRGVNLYDFDWDDLHTILRPTGPIDFGAAMAWFATVRGQRYGYWQALRFFRLGKEDVTRMMCSPFCTRWYRAGGFHPFAGQYDASLVSPGMFLSSCQFTTVWRADPEA